MILLPPSEDSTTPAAGPAPVNARSASDMAIWVVMGLRPMKIVSGLRRMESLTRYKPAGRKMTFALSIASLKAGRSSATPSPLAPKILMLAHVSTLGRKGMSDGTGGGAADSVTSWLMVRSEERRVGKEC